MVTARQWSSQWIWRGHYRAAVRGGLDPSVGADIAAGKRPEKMKEDETILYNYATEMYRDKAVSDATYAAAVKQFGEKALIDLVATMGYYDTVAMTLITAKAVAPKEEDVPQLAALAVSLPRKIGRYPPPVGAKTENRLSPKNPAKQPVQR